jgi:transposase-like protein
MGKIRRKFEVEFKRRLIEQIKTGEMTPSQAAREYQISPSVIQRWRTQYGASQLVDRPSSRERALEAENQRLKAKVGDLVMQIDHLKKLQRWLERNRNVDTAVITGKNWDRYRKDAK